MTGISKAKAFAQYLLGKEVSAKMHHTRKNTIHGHTFQNNIWSSKLYKNSFIPYTVKQWNWLQQEVVNIECNDHFTYSLRKYLGLQNYLFIIVIIIILFCFLSCFV